MNAWKNLHACGFLSEQLCWWQPGRIHFHTFSPAMFCTNSTMYFTSICVVYCYVLEQQKAYHLTRSIPLLHFCPHPRQLPVAGRQMFLPLPRKTQQPGMGMASYSTQGRCRWHQWSSASPCSGTSLGLEDGAETVAEMRLQKVTAVM